MLISIADAATYLEMDTSNIYLNKELRALVVKTDMGNYIEEKELRAWRIERDRKEAFKVDMTMFAEFVISKIGEKDFYEPFDYNRRQHIRDWLKKENLSFLGACKVEEQYGSWKERFETFLLEGEEKVPYIPFLKREPLTDSFVMKHHWSGRKTTGQIAKELNVPKGWVIKEIKRLGLQKKDNGIQRKGRNGWVASQSFKDVRKNQPHRKEVVQICPTSFSILKTYRSTTAVEEDDFNRENVRKAIKTAGMHKGYLWAYKGFETVVINVAKRRGNLETKLNVRAYKQPNKETLKKLYIDKNMSTHDIAQIYKCHHGTIAALASKYELKKRTKKIAVEELKHLRLVEGLSTKQIAQKQGCKESTISRYLWENKIKRRGEHVQNVA